MANTMKTSLFSFKVGIVCLLLSAYGCSGDLFGSLRFTRKALFGFSRVAPNPETELPVPVFSLVRSLESDSPTKRPQQRTIYTPSNKFLEVISEIQKAVANAGAMGSHLQYSNLTLAKLSQLLEDAVKSKSFDYGREVLGRILYLLSKSSKRKKRSLENEGNLFLRRLRQGLGNETFDSFMAVEGNVSLVFVIDDTGSMGDTIEAVKKIATAVINYPREVPVDYILSPFNDPMSDAGEVVFKESEQSLEFVDAINALTAHRGGDCAEYTLAGIVNAFGQDPLFGSPMYVFTDAGPKDATEEKIEEVKILAEMDDVTIHFLTTGACGGKLHPAFRELAEFTSGQVVLLKSAEELEKLANVIRGALEGTTIISFGSSVSGRKKRTSGGLRRYRFPVDDSIETVTISVKTNQPDTNGRDITLRNPSGAIITAQKVNLSQLCFYQIASPPKGYWTLEITTDTTGDHEFYVKSTSKTNINFKHYFMIPVGRRRRKSEVPFSNPIARKSNTMVLTLLAPNDKVDPASLRLQIVTASGSVVRNLNLSSNDNVHYEVSFTPPATAFKLKLLGVTQKGFAFERLSRRFIQPSTAFLRGRYASNDFTLPLNSLTLIQFEICNFGPSERFEVLVRKDWMNYVSQPSAGSQRPTLVGKGRCVALFLRARATRVADVHKTNTVILIVKGQSSGIVLSRLMRLFVVNPKRS